MNPTISSLPKILEFIKTKQTTTAQEIQRHFGLSQVSIFKHLKTLVESNKVQKVGSVPKVYYIFNSNFVSEKENSLIQKTLNESLDEQQLIILKQKFIQISPEGYIQYGIDGFKSWCSKQHLDFKKTSTEYLQTWEKYFQYYSKIKNFNYINASFKLEETFQNNRFLEKLFYLDFYAIERFGKTKLAQLTFQAKQSQDKTMLDNIILQTKDTIEALIVNNKIEAVGFVPATVNRKVQFMELLEKKLDLKLPKIKIEKIIYDTPVQQKTLKSKLDRIDNANKTFFIPEQNTYKKIMLIDDFVGSGATLNQISKQLINKHIAQKIFGIGLTGSFKGFEVINQV